MKQKVWVVNFLDEDFHLYTSKEEAIKAVEHNYAVYQCYGCHHEETATKKAHAEHGLDDIGACAQCHEGPGGE